MFLSPVHPLFVFLSFRLFRLSVFSSLGIFVFLTFRLSAFLSFSPFVFLSFHLSVFSSFCLFVFPSFCLYVFSSFFVFLSFCLFVFLSFCLSGTLHLTSCSWPRTFWSRFVRSNFPIVKFSQLYNGKLLLPMLLQNPHIYTGTGSKVTCVIL